MQRGFQSVGKKTSKITLFNMKVGGQYGLVNATLGVLIYIDPASLAHAEDNFALIDLCVFFAAIGKVEGCGRNMSSK